jgi:hypothetical protein
MIIRARIVGVMINNFSSNFQNFKSYLLKNQRIGSVLNGFLKPWHWNQQNLQYFEKTCAVRILRQKSLLPGMVNGYGISLVEEIMDVS